MPVIKAAKKKASFLLGALVLLGGYLTPQIGVISNSGWRILSILIFAIIFWSSEALPASATAMAILILLPLTGVRSYQATFASLGTVMIWRLVSIFIITEAIRRVGLADRIAYRFILLMRGKVRRTLLCVLLLAFAFAFILPNSYSRTVLFVTIIVSWLRAAGLPPSSNVAKAFMISIPLVCTITASAIIVGASVDIFAADLFNTLVGYHWSYFRWLLTNAPFCLLMTLAVYFLAIAVFKPEVDELGQLEVIRERLRALGSLSWQERQVIFIFAALMACWFTDLSESIPAEMLVGFVMILPGRRQIMSWKEAMDSVNWPIILLFGASISMADSLQHSTLIDWLNGAVSQGMGGSGVLLIALLTVVATALIRLGMSNMTGAVATLLPLLINVAAGLGMNPVWLGMICVLSSCTSFFFPAQSVNNLFSYGFGYFNNRDFLRFGLLLFPLFILCLLFCAFCYWPAIGLPL